MLFIVSTPIGNLGDITKRAIETLASSDIIAAEDTRRSGMLLKKLEISAKLISYNDRNKVSRSKHLLKLLLAGQKVSLVSDAGTPGVNDPAFYLVREAVKAGIKVIPVPGACAAIAALVASGCPTDSFEFHGFVPKKGKKKTDFLESLVNAKKTIVCYESPYRLLKTLTLMNEIIPNRFICIAREITKMHEEFIYGTAKDALDRFSKNKPRGEFVIVISK